MTKIARRAVRQIVSILTDRCVCGLPLKFHRDRENRFLSCNDAAERQRYAGIRHTRLREIMLASLDEQRRQK